MATKGGTRRPGGITDDQIIESYRHLKSGPEVARRLGLGKTTVQKVLRRAGVHCLGTTRNDKAHLPPGWWKRYEGDERQVADWYRSGLSQSEVARRIGRSVRVVSRIVKAFGLSAPSGKGPEHAHWNGGRRFVGGYWRVWIAGDDPMSAMRSKNGTVMEHRLVMARKLGRPLRPNETVHHLDGDRANNDLSNLQLRQGRHGNHVVMRCAVCGSQDLEHIPIGEAACLPMPRVSAGRLGFAFL